MTAIINISDTFFCCANGTQLSEADIGFAYCQSKQPVVIGHAALPYLKTQPGKMNTRFWHELNTVPITTQALHVRHHADLAWHQIKHHIHDLPTQDVALIVPSHYSQNDLNLLAGICQSLKLRVSAVIDRALGFSLQYAESLSASPTPFAYVEIQQHQSVLVWLEIKESKLQISRVETFASHGLLRIYDKCLYLIRQKLIHSERFDPLYQGQTEQQLFEQLKGMDVSSDGSTTFRINYEGNEYKLDVANDELISVSTPFLKEVYSRVGALPVLFDSTFKYLPKPVLRAQDFICEPNPLFSHAAHLLSRQQDHDQTTHYICETSLQINNQQRDQHVVSPSHILLDGIAYPLGFYRFINTLSSQERLIVENNPQRAHIAVINNAFSLGERASELYINGQQGRSGTKLSLNDTLSLAEATPLSERASVIAIREKVLP